MHPILQNLRSSLESPANATNSPGTDSGKPEESKTSINVGIASKNDEESKLRRSQREDRLPKAKVPVVDLFRDEEPRMAEERDLMYNASKSIEIDTHKKLEPDSFSPDLPGSNPAQRHIEAAELYRNGVYTRDLEQWAFDTFLSHAKQLLSRPNISLGLTYLDDFVQTFLDHPRSSELIYQLFTLISHTSEPTLKRMLTNICNRDKKNKLTHKWLIDLITCLYLIVRDEQTITERLSALLTTSNHLAVFFAKRASGGFYPTADKLAKTHIFFKRIILGLLTLADNIGSYSRNSLRQPLKKVKVAIEPSDESYMFSLKGALENPESDEEEEWSVQ